MICSICNIFSLLITQYLSFFNLKIQINLMTFIKCLDCGDILESKFIHDFIKYLCTNPLFLDGGDDYMRYAGKGTEENQYFIVNSLNLIYL